MNISGRHIGALPAAFLFLALLGNSTQAQEAPKPSPAAADSKTTWGIGVGIAMQKKVYTGADTKLKVLPFLFVDNRWVRVAGTGVDLKLGSAGGLAFALRGRLALGDGYKSSDADILDGMNRRKGSIWVGPSAVWKNDVVDVSGEVLADASRHSKGPQATLALSKEFRSGRFTLEPRLSANWLSAKYVDYYYGVEAGEALANRPAYNGKSTVNLGLNLRVTYGLTANQSVTLDMGARRLGNAIEDSPLVDKRVQPLLSLGYLYRF